MKILKRGVKPEEKIYIGKCNICGTIVEAKGNEVKNTYDQRDGDYHTINCPVCNNYSLMYMQIEGSSVGIAIKREV